MKIHLFYFSALIFVLRYCGNLPDPQESFSKKERLVNHADQDSQYNKRELLDTLSRILSESLPKYKEFFPGGFDVANDGTPGGFFVYDLTDTLNNTISDHGKFEFRNNHIFYFAPNNATFSTSNILILEDGRIKIFLAVNCDKGDRVTDILSYMSGRPALITDGIEDRIRNCHNYGWYSMVDVHSSLDCNYYRPAR